MILEYNDITNFEVTECRKDNMLSITVSGLCMHSGYVVEKMITRKNKDKICIKIIISFLKKKKQSGNFLYEVIIPDDVNTVVLGNEEYEIWSRDYSKYKIIKTNGTAK